MTILLTQYVHQESEQALKEEPHHDPDHRARQEPDCHHVFPGRNLDSNRQLHPDHHQYFRHPLEIFSQEGIREF